MDSITRATWVIAAATVINLFVSIGLWLATRASVEVARRVFEAANRPYVGSEGIITGKNDTRKTLDFTASFKNFGSVPADETLFDWDVLLNGVKQHQTRIPDTPITFFPGATAGLHGFIGTNDFDQLMSGQLVLEATLRSTYQGSENKHYAYCERYRYAPNINQFYNLGRCEEKPQH